MTALDSIGPSAAAVRAIVRAVSELTGVPYMEIVGRRRYHRVSAARRMVWWLLRRHLRCSLPDIGRLTGNGTPFHHSSVLTGIRAVDAWVARRAPASRPLVELDEQMTEREFGPMPGPAPESE